MKKIEKKEYVIDATGRALGRIASEAANLLRGKNNPDFVKHLSPEVIVKIVNASKLSVSPKKMKEKIYTHYTGHPGGLRRTPLNRLIDKKGWSEPIKKAVYGMLPANRLRATAIKKLIITE